MRISKGMGVRASVAMAAYNGEKYLEEQIDSILDMMSQMDELVISYETSYDRTLEIIQKYVEIDDRVQLVYDSGQSVESNFNNAVMCCKGKYIFLADQDDVWIHNKINKMVDFFEAHQDVKVLIGNGYITDEHLNVVGELFHEYHTSINPIRNFIKGTYLGCQMAFNSDIKNFVWPVCDNPPLAHDLWLGVCGAKYGKIAKLDDKLILHRLHSDNYSNTSKMTIFGVIQNRLLFLKKLIGQ